MSRQDTERAPVCFQDVTACFSEVEWKLLHEWQKELYRNVMKDIHQALVALGPLIATSIFALRAEEKEPPLGSHDYLTRHSAHHFSSDSNFHSDLSVGISQEKVQSMMETQDKSTGDVTLKAVLSPNIKENKETYLQTSLEGEGRSKSVGSMMRRFEVVNSLKGTETSMACKTLPGEDDSNVLQISENGKYSESRVWSKSNAEIMIENAKKCERSFSKPSHSNICQVNSKAEISETYDQTDSVLGNAQLLTSHAGSLPNPTPCTYTDYGKSTRQNIDSITYQKKQVEGDNVYLCADSKKSQSMGLQNMQYKEREYQCTDCDKSFMRKHHLKEHQRIHSGEKPYVCTICGKDFCRSGALNRHVKTHNFPDSMSSVLPGIACMQKGDPTWSL